MKEKELFIPQPEERTPIPGEEQEYRLPRRQRRMIRRMVNPRRKPKW